MIKTPEERHIWQRCFWAGALTLVLGTIVISLFPSEGGDYPAGYGDPVIAFEFAQSASEVQSAIGNGEDSLNAMKTGTYGDFIFILAFTIFMVSFFHAAKRQTGLAIYKFLAAIALIAGLSDFIEDIFALRILSDIDISSGVEWMHYFAKAKFLALSLCAFGAGTFLLEQPRTLRRFEGTLATLGGTFTIYALTRPDQLGDMLGLGVIMSWIAMLAYAATQSFKKI